MVITGEDLSWGLIWGIGLAMTAVSAVLIWRKLDSGQGYGGGSESEADYGTGSCDPD
nr:hypothetical protein OG461_11005 [Streptomyces sp. NBC_00995]